MTWLDDLEALWVPSDPVALTDELRSWLTYRYEVAARLQPASIVEIGVRAGYSAFAMLSAVPDAEFLGIDARKANYGFADFEAESRRVLARFGGVTLVRQDSLCISRLGPADLIHIDGDHTTKGCLSDLALAARSGIRWALVDDVDLLPAVRKAVVRFMAEHDIQDAEYHHDGMRGSALLRL